MLCQQQITDIPEIFLLSQVGQIVVKEVAKSVAAKVRQTLAV